MNERQRAKFEERFGPYYRGDHASIAEAAYSAACQDEADAVKGLVEALEQMTQMQPCDCGCPEGKSPVLLKPAHYYTIAKDALLAFKGDAK